MTVSNLWKRIEWKCMEHRDPVPMYVFGDSNSPFYACPKYMLKDEAHPDGHERSEPGCANRASFDDVRHIVEILGSRIAEDAENGEICDYTGMRMNWKTITAVVLRYGEKKIEIGLQNRRKIGVWR